MRRLVPLAVVLAVAGCEQSRGPFDFSDPFERPEPGTDCDLFEVNSHTLGSIHPAREYRIACANQEPSRVPSIALVDDAIWVLSDSWNFPDDGYGPAFVDWRLYRVADHQVEVVPFADDDDEIWAALIVDDHGDPWLFGDQRESSSSQTPLWFAHPSKDAAEIERLPTDLSGWFGRAEFGGEVPNLWFTDQAPMRSTPNDEGAWFGQPVPEVEGFDDNWATFGLDGAGRQLVYASRQGPDPGQIEISTHDGHWTTALGTFTDARYVLPIPSAHPTDPSHEHAAVVVGWDSVTVVWPESGERLVIPYSPTLDDLYCTMIDAPVATRTGDGRIWLAWAIVSPFNCELPGPEAPTLRLVEVDPTDRSAHEVMRLELDASGLNDNTNFVDWFEVALALTSYGDQLALVIADGPEDQRFHVIHIDVSDDLD